jgi:hypothetical protein
MRSDILSRACLYEALQQQLVVNVGRSCARVSADIHSLHKEDEFQGMCVKRAFLTASS